MRTARCDLRARSARGGLHLGRGGIAQRAESSGHRFERRLHLPEDLRWSVGEHAIHAIFEFDEGIPHADDALLDLRLSDYDGCRQSIDCSVAAGRDLHAGLLNKIRCGLPRLCSGSEPQADHRATIGLGHDDGSGLVDELPTGSDGKLKAEDRMIEDAIADETFARIVTINQTVDATQMLLFANEWGRSGRRGNGVRELHHALGAISRIGVR